VLGAEPVRGRGTAKRWWWWQQQQQQQHRQRHWAASRSSSPTHRDQLAARQDRPVSEEKMEADPSSVWGLCVCVDGVHRPEGLAVVRE
ncbi:unnamed protein product, partial [Ectocarpus sp. 12 AP-2014]